MDAVSYPENNVSDFITSNLIPLRIPANDPVLGPKFTVKWTPALLILDRDGNEQSRSLGFLAPNELIPSLLLGIGRCHFSRGERSDAIRSLDALLEAYPGSFAAPESVYLRGVASYIDSHDVAHLTGLYDRLTSDYSGSEWAMRAAPYRLLKK